MATIDQALGQVWQTIGKMQRQTELLQTVGYRDITRYVVQGLTTGGTVSSTTVIQSYVDACSTAGGGLVWLPPGLFLTGKLVLKNRVWLIGAGMYATALKLADGTDDNLIENYVGTDATDPDTANAEFCGVLNMRLTGNKANQAGTSHGIKFEVQPETAVNTADLDWDPHQLVENVWIDNFLTDGIYYISKGESRFNNVVAYLNDGYGFNIFYDNFLVNCTAMWNGEAGFRLGGSTRGSNLKAFYNGQVTAANGHGFLFWDGPGDYVGITAQDNEASGILIYNCGGINLVADADSNSKSSIAQYPGVDIYGGHHCNVKLVSQDRKANDGVNYYQTKALGLRNGATGNNVDLTHYAASTPAYFPLVALVAVGTVSGGHFHATYSGQTTGEIAYNASASDIDTALEALSNIAAGEVTAKQGPLPTEMVPIAFGGTLGHSHAATMTIDNTAITGGGSIQLVQAVLLKRGVVSGGHFHITYSGQTTGELAYNCTASDVQTALEALSNIGAGEAPCYGGPAPSTAIYPTLTGTLDPTDAGSMSIDSSAITGGGIIDLVAIKDMDPILDGSSLTGNSVVQNGLTPNMTVLSASLYGPNFDGQSWSTQAKTKIDLSAEFGAPDNIKTVLLKVIVKDSASSTDYCTVLFSADDTADLGVEVSCQGQANDQPVRTQVTVPCDDNGDIWYQVVASGASTTDMWIEVWGYQRG